MNKILVEVSVGELFDKMSILEIKKDRIKDSEKLKFINDEYEVLKSELEKNVKLDEKDAEITRYKEGYDTKKIKSSLTGYIKVRDRIQSYADNEKTSINDLDKLLIIIESAIDNLGASEIEIKIGDNFYDDKYVGLTDDPEIIETDDPEKDGLIAAIVKKGYEIIGQETNTNIRSAKLKIYKHEPKEN